MYTIMIVDDEKTIRTHFPYIVDFNRFGFQISAVARNGRDALEQFMQNPVDLVFLDVCMPVLDGLGFLKELSESVEAEAMPYVVMLSGYSDFEYAREAMRYGARAYLVKPVDEDEVERLLEQLKQNLDKHAHKAADSGIGEQAAHAMKLFHGWDGDRGKLQDFLVLHCVLLSSEHKDAEGPDSVRQALEEKIPGGREAFMRNRGSVFSYLLPREALEEYQRNTLLFCRHIAYHLKQRGWICALFADGDIFRKKEGMFRRDYDAYLYCMMTKVFWGTDTVFSEDAGLHLENEGEERRLKNEASCMNEIRQSILKRDEKRLLEVWQETELEIVEKRLDVVAIQEISYRIYYVLLDILQERQIPCEDLFPVDMRDSRYFPRQDAWREEIRRQIFTVFSLVLERDKTRGGDLGEKAVAYVEEHFREPITLKDVAGACYVNAAYLGRCFQKTTGTSFRQYLTNLRMEEAKRLLMRTDKKVYEIAEEAGFGESKYFVMKFTESMGCTPAEYRKQDLQKPQDLHTK